MVVAMVVVTNSVIGGFSWMDLVWLAASTVRLEPTVRLQLYRMNSEKWSSRCTNHIWGNCNGYDYPVLLVIGWVESSSVCNHTSNKQNRTIARREFDFFSIGIRRLNLLLPITQTRYNSPKKQIHLGHISPWETMSLEKIPPFWKFQIFFSG